MLKLSLISIALAASHVAATDTACESAGKAFFTACNDTITDDVTCPTACSDAHVALVAAIAAEADTTDIPSCQVKPTIAVADSDMVWTWMAWRWSADVDMELAKRGINTNPCTFAEDSECDKNFMMASDYTPTYNCDKTCSSKCTGLVTAFTDHCTAGRNYTQENGLIIGHAEQNLMVALLNKCVDFMGNHPVTGEAYCEREKLEDAFCPMISGLPADLRTTACALDTNVMVLLGGNPALLDVLLGSLLPAGTVLPPGIQAGLVGVGPCFTKLGVTGLLKDICTKSCVSLVTEEEIIAPEAAGTSLFASTMLLTAVAPVALQLV